MTDKKNLFSTELPTKTNKRSKVLLIGASGYVGSFVLQALLQAGHIVTATYRVYTHDLDIRLANWIQLDVTKPSTFSQKPKSFDAVIYLASSLSNENEKVIHTDIQGLQNVLAANFAPYFLFCSSIDVYGRTLCNSTDEQLLPQPESWYGFGKLYSENAINIWTGEVSGRKNFILRAPFLLGVHKKICNSFWGRIVLTALHKRKIILSKYDYRTIASRGFNWAPVSTVAEIFTLSLAINPEGQYNSISNYITWREFFDILGAIIGCNDFITCERHQDEGIKLFNHNGRLCNNKILTKPDLGLSYSQSVSLSSTLKEICNYFTQTSFIKLQPNSF